MKGDAKVIEFLNQALKVIIYDAELDQVGLNLQEFVQTLAENF